MKKLILILSVIGLFTACSTSSEEKTTNVDSVAVDSVAMAVDSFLVDSLECCVDSTEK
jgi:hypothetical protein